MRQVVRITWELDVPSDLNVEQVLRDAAENHDGYTVLYREELVREYDENEVKGRA